MALYHAHANYISRASTNSSCSHAAYICGEKVTDFRTNTSFDYRNKAAEVVYKNILLPQGAEHLNSTEKLWNAVEEFEDKIAEERYGKYDDPIKKAKSLAAKERFLAKAVTAFKMECSLPLEMTLPEKKELSDRVAKEIFGSRNLIVQYAIHDIKNNPHVHYVANFRPVIDGEFSKRKIYFEASDIKAIRKQIADITNDYAAEKGYNFAIDHRSYLEQGIEIEPTKHRGWWASKFIDNSRIVLENNEILSKNAARLLEDPHELLKVLVQNKTVFTLEELKSAVKEKCGDDHQVLHVMRELINQESADSLIEKAAYFGQFLEVAHRLRECALNSGEEQLPEDKLFIKALREERQLFATKIIENENDYKWLMSRVGIKGDIIEAMVSETLTWNDRSLFIGHNVPSNLKSGDTLAFLAKSLGNKDLDQGLVSIFNLENLGSYVLGRDAYISQTDLTAEKNIIESRKKLSNSSFGVEVSLAVKLFKKRPEQNIYSVIEHQEKKQGYKLSNEQKEAATYLVGSSAYGALIGKAGTGKTTTLRVVAASYQKAGFRVIGTSFQGAAVAELGVSLGAYMDSGFTLSRLDKEWRSIDKGSSSNNKVNEYELSDKTVVIVDEAAMAPRHLLQSLLTRAIEKKAKIISVGDTGQISSIDRSDISRLVLESGAVLDEVRRQNNPGDAKASNYFARGFIKSGLEIYENKGSIVISETEFSSKLSLIHNVASKLEPSNLFKHLIIAYKNSDVEDLNSGMQRILKENGKLGDKITLLTGFDKVSDKVRGDILANSVISKALAATGNNIIQFKKDTLSYEDTHTLLAKLDRDGSEYEMLTNILKPKEFYVGDKIRFTSNFNKGIGGSKIYNGSLGIIESYDSKNNSIVVMCEDQEQRTVDLTCYQGLDLGYVVTINRSQGKGVENSYVYLANTRGAKIGSKEFYVAATRHRGKVIFYTSREYLQDKELYQKIGERWKVTARDLKDNPELELVFKLEEKSGEEYLLWSDMQKDVRGGKCNLYEHEKFKDYRQLKSELAKLSIKAKDNWDRVRIYASESMISLDDIERWIGSEDQNMRYKENSKLREYRELRSKTAELWDSILGSRSSTTTQENSRKFNPDAKLKDQNAQALWNKKSENHILTPTARAELYAKFNKSANLRNKLAYELASFGAKEQIYDRSGNLITTNIYNHTDKSEWRSILRHSNMYIKSMTESKSVREDFTREIDTKPTLQEMHIMLKAAVANNAENIAHKLLGEPNKKLSSRQELRFGENGSISVKISGVKSGTWYDFSTSSGGDMFDLVCSRSGCNFKEAADYLRSEVGMGNNISGTTFKKYDPAAGTYGKHVGDRELTDEQKQAKVNKLYARSGKLEENSIALRYLQEHRSISCSGGDDVKQANIYIGDRHYYLPALVAFARDAKGNITGYQQILLDKNTAAKADIPAPKRSFGKISGSFVEVSKGRNSDITIIAEGLETALSIKEALSEHGDEKKGMRPIRILCSLGINNIKNYSPKEGERIIIAADNDGPDSITAKTTVNAKHTLEEKGAFVEIVYPSKEGDFNDVLQDALLGKQEIQNSFNKALAKHGAVTLREYFRSKEDTELLSEKEKIDIGYISRFRVDERKIVNAYRVSQVQGRQVLEQTQASLEKASFCYGQNKEVLLEAKQWRYGLNEIDAIKDVQGMDELEASNFYREKRDEYLNKSLEYNISLFSKLKKQANNMLELKKAITAEQGYLQETYQSLRSPIQGMQGRMLDYLKCGEIAAKEPEHLRKTFVLADKLINEYGQSELDVCRNFLGSTNTKLLYVKFDQDAEFYGTKTAIERLTSNIRNASTIPEVIAALNEKQKFCAHLGQNLKYTENSDYFKEIIEFAATAQEDKLPEKLRETVNSLLALGIHSQDELLLELRNTGNSRNTYLKLDKTIEICSIAKTLSELDATRSKSPDIVKTIELLGTKDKFLAGLQGNLKYPEIHYKSLMQSIQNAARAEQNNNLRHLEKISILHMNQVGTKPSTLNEILKSSQDSTHAFETLQKSYRVHIISEVHKSLKVIDDGKNVRLDNKNFNCPVKFLNYVTATRTHKYFPHKEVRQIYEQIRAHQKQLNLSKDMDGPSL